MIFTDFMHKFNFILMYRVFTQNTIHEWSTVFVVGAIIYISPAVFFIFFGSGNVQPWNEPPTKQLDAETTNKDVQTIVVTPSNATTTSPSA